ncbi:MAG: ABC transporter substrate-binding protein [bacterium]
MKKYLVGFIILCLLSGLVFIMSCSTQQPPSPTGQKITYLRWMVDGNPIRKEQMAAFEKSNPDIKIKPDYPGINVTAEQKALTQIVGGEPPDVFTVYGTNFFRVLSEKSALLDLTPYIKKDNIDMTDFWPQLKPFIYGDNGKIYGLPDNMTDLVVFYNKRLFQEAGIPFPKDGWTLDEMLDIAKKLTKRDSKTGRVMQYGIYYWKEVQPIIWQFGGRLYSDDGKRCTFDSPECLAAIEFVNDLQMKYHVMPTLAEENQIANLGNWGGAMNLFTAEKVAMSVGGRYMTVSYRQRKDLEWSIAPLPRGKYPANFAFSKSYVIPHNAKHPEESFRFVKFLADKEDELIVTRTGDGLPSRISVSKLPEFLFNPEFPKEDKNQIYLDEMQIARTVEISPYVPGFEEARILNEEFGKLWAKKQTPKETVTNVAKQINALIKK